MIIAHRGNAKKAAENTIAAFDAAFAAGADAAETDVRLTRDNQAVVSHDDAVNLSGKRLKISKTPLPDILRLRGQGAERMLTLDELFDYAIAKHRPFFVELKSNSKRLASEVVEQIAKHNAWDNIHVLGFFTRIKSALSLQSQYPKLKVCQLLMLPAWTRIKKPKPSHSVYIGWLPAIPGSEALFRRFFSEDKLRAWREYFEELGFAVMCGVINHAEGINFFQRAGFSDIFTDDIELVIQSTNAKN